METIEGTLDGKGIKVAIVASRFNDFINDKLIGGARDALLRHGTADNDITLIRVPGAFEIPFVVAKALSAKRFDAIICIGTIIRGATSHYEFLSSSVTKEISTLALASTIPIIYGVITTENIEQAIERAGTKAGNKGWDASVCAIEMINLNKLSL